MPRDLVALVSADDLIAAVRVHADRVHDLLRRSGCAGDEAVEVTESYAFALIDAIVNAPETVVDMAGWWFGRALDLSRRLGDTAAEPADETPTSVLAGTEGEAQVRAVLAALPENERTVIVLRDAYDLPAQSVAVALRRDLTTVASTVAVARLHLVARYDNRPVADLSGHNARSAVDVALLGALADGSLAPQRAAPLRRHVATCPACEEVVDALAKGRRLAAGLPVLAMPDDAREGMIERVAERAHAVLPSVDEVLIAIEEDDEVRPAVSPVVAIFAIVIAVVLGVAVAAVTRSGPTGAPAGNTGNASQAPLQPSFSVSATPSVSATASASGSASATATATASTTASASGTTPPPNVAPEIALAPNQGPRGTRITVAGRGFPPSTGVTVTYAGAISSSRATGTVNSGGRFTLVITANGLVPGDYTVTATDGADTAQSSFAQTT